MSEGGHISPFHLVLCQPVIPQNTGSIARLCACTGTTLHLIHPLGFRTDEKSVRRAGLDYWPHVDVHEHRSWAEFDATEAPECLYFFSKFASRLYTEAEFRRPLYLVFGSETIGLPDDLWHRYPDRFFRLPMRTEIVRSLNLAQSCAIVLYEALRQNGFETLKQIPPPSRRPRIAELKDGSAKPCG